jgi:hypothetical protein
MAGGDELVSAGGGKGDRTLSAILFLAASTNAFDAYSALNSSPWTAESFGGDPAKEKSLREYVNHAIVITSGYGIASALIARNVWPVIGTFIADVYMYWLYMRAIRRAQARGSQDWDS